MAQITELVRNELKTPNLATALIGGAVTRGVDNYLASVINCKYIMSEVQQQMLNKMFGGRIDFSVQSVKVDHPVLKFVHDQMVEHMVRSVKRVRRVLLIGTTLKELMHFAHRCPSVEFSGVIGLVDLKDDARIADGRLKATRHLGDEKTPAAARVICQSYLDTITDGQPSPRFCLHTAPWRDDRTFDVAICLDSLYDMHQDDFLEYGARYQIQKFYACMLSAPELLYVDHTINGVYDVEFLRLKGLFGNNIAMRYSHSVANGYIHRESTFLNWHKHIVFQNKQVAYMMEAQFTYESYSFLTFSRVKAGSLHTIVTPFRFSSEFRRIFNAPKYIKYEKYDYFFVDRHKYDECLLYAMRLSIGAFEPTKVLSYMGAKLHKVIIGGQEFAKTWSITQRDLERTAFFVIMHAALLRGELFEFNSEIVGRSKKGGYKDGWFRTRWNRFVEWLCKTENRKVLHDIERADKSVCHDFKVYYECVKSDNGNPTDDRIPMPPAGPGLTSPTSPKHVRWTCPTCAGTMGHCTRCTQSTHSHELRTTPLLWHDRLEVLKRLNKLQTALVEAEADLAKLTRRCERAAQRGRQPDMAKFHECVRDKRRLETELEHVKVEMRTMDEAIAERVKRNAQVNREPVKRPTNHVVTRERTVDAEWLRECRQNAVLEVMTNAELDTYFKTLEARRHALDFANPQDEGGPSGEGTDSGSDVATPELARRLHDRAEQALQVVELALGGPTVEEVQSSGSVTSDEAPVDKGKAHVADSQSETVASDRDTPSPPFAPVTTFHDEYGRNWATEMESDEKKGPKPVPEAVIPSSDGDHVPKPVVETSKPNRQQPEQVKTHKPQVVIAGADQKPASRVNENNNNKTPTEAPARKLTVQEIARRAPRVVEENPFVDTPVLHKEGETPVTAEMLSKELRAVGDAIAEEEHRIFSDPNCVNALMKAGVKTKKWGNQAGAKAEQIIEKLSLDIKDSSILDICAGPGAATRYFCSLSKNVVSVTRRSTTASENFYPDLKSRQLYCDIVTGWDPIKAEWGSPTADFVYADGAAPCEGSAREKEAANVQLLQRQLLYAIHHLRVGGTIVCKIIGGELQETRDIINTYLQLFEEVTPVLPANTKKTNNEWYLAFIGLHKRIRNYPKYLRQFTSKYENTHIMEAIIGRLKIQLAALQSIKPVMVAAAEPQQLRRPDIDDNGFFLGRKAPPGWKGPYPDETDVIDESDLTKLGKYYHNMKRTAEFLQREWSDRFCIPDDVCRTLLRKCISDYKLKQNAEGNDFYELHKRIVDKRENVVPLPTYQGIKMRMLDMVAGAGKTWGIAQDFDVERDLYVTSLSKGRLEFVETIVDRDGRKPKHTFAMTIDNFLTSERLSTARRIFVDEYTTFPIHWLILVMTLAPQAEYVVVGNIDQCGFQDQFAFLGANAGITHWTKYLPKPTFCTETRRFGPRVSSFLRNNFAYRIKTHSCVNCGVEHPIVPNTLVTKSSFADRLLKPDLHLAFSSKTIKAIGAKRKSSANTVGFTCLSVRESQGASVGSTNLYLSTTHGDQEMYQVRELAIVAFSRTKNHLNLVEWDNKALEATGYNIMAAPLNAEIATGIPFVPMPEKFVKTKDEIEQPIPLRTAEFDAKALEESLPNPHAELQQERHSFIFAAPEGKATATTFPLEKRAKPTVARWTLNSYGKKYQHGPHQTLWTALSRLANKNAPTVKVAAEYTYNTAQAFRKKFLKEKIEFPMFYHEFAENVLRVFQKYKEQHKLPEIDIVDPSLHGIIRMFIKAQTKIKHEMDQLSLDPAKLNSTLSNKPGQPILAWAKALNVAYSPFFPVLERVFVHNLKDEYVYANGKNDQDLEEALNGLPKWTSALCNDVSEYDSRQNFRTQNLEYAVLQTLVPNDCLAEYYQFRKGMKVLSDVCSYYQSGKKSSGEPATLFTNCVLLFPYMNLVCPDAVAMVVKGDDSIVFYDKIGRDIKVDLARGKELLECDLKTLMTTIPEFCGYLYGNGVWCYNMRTWARKILDKDFSADPRVARKELADHQNATRDKLRGVGETGSTRYQMVVRSHAEHMKVPEKQVEFWIEQARGYCDVPFETFWREKVLVVPDFSNAA